MRHVSKVLFFIIILLVLLGMTGAFIHSTAQASVTAETPAAFTCSGVTTIPQSECQALVDLYTSTDGPNWHDNRGWLEDTNPCTWFGIFCANDHITHIHLWDNDLRGPLPDSIGSFPQLETLDLFYNALTGTLPPSLGNLAQLKILNLSQAFSVLPGEGLIGPLPASLGNLVNLEWLSLYGNFSGMMPLGLMNLTKLKLLYLSRGPCVPADSVVDDWLATIADVAAYVRDCTLADATNVFVNGSLEGGPFAINPNWWRIEYSSFFTGTAPFTDVQPRTGRAAGILGAYQPGVPEVAPFRFDRLQQTVDVPSRANVAISFHYQIRSDDECGRDFAYVFAKLPMQRPVQIGAFELCQATQTSGWTEAVLDLSAYANTTIDIYFDVRLSEMNGSAFYVDDIYLPHNPIVTPDPSHTSLFLPTIQSSRSSEVPYTLGCNPSGGSGGLSPGAHVTQVAGLEALVVVGSGYNPERPTFLSFYLHGDGGEDYRWHEGGPVRQIVDEQGWIFVTPLAPSPFIVRPSLPYPHRWNPDGYLKTEHLAAVFNEMFASYNLCQDVLLGSGASGGSVFWDQYFFPLKGDTYPAFFSFTCGGGGFHDAYRSDMQERINSYDSIKTRSRFHYRIGTTDFLYATTQASATARANTGYNTIFEPLDGVDHCAFDTASAIREHWQRAVNDFNLNGLRP